MYQRAQVLRGNRQGSKIDVAAKFHFFGHALEAINMVVVILNPLFDAVRDVAFAAGLEQLRSQVTTQAIKLLAQIAACRGLPATLSLEIFDAGVEPVKIEMLIKC